MYTKPLPHTLKHSENHKTLKDEDDFKTEIMIVNSKTNIQLPIPQFCGSHCTIS